MKFPHLYEAAETASAENQRKFLVSRGVEFVALLLAACFGELPRDVLWHAGPWLAVAFFVLALIVRLSGVGDRAEKRWYDARAAAESVKSSAWQFAVGGEAFRISDSTATQRFREALRAVLETLPTLDVPAPSNTDAVVTQKMGSLRSSDIANRAEIYLKERVEDQVHWYATKAKWNRRRASQWRWILIGVDAVAVCLGVLRATAVLHVNWLGIFPVAATGVAAWQQTKTIGP